MTINERVESTAQWILRRAPELKAANLPKLLQAMLDKQRAEDIDKAWDWIVSWVFENAPHKTFDSLTSDREDFLKAMETCNSDKNLQELTQQDVKRIDEILTEVACDRSFTDCNIEAYYTEVLRRFKEESK